MSYEMSLLRKEDLSLYFYIKDIVLKNFQETAEDEYLVPVPELCGENSYVYRCLFDSVPSPDEEGRGWLYFDTSVSGTGCSSFHQISGLNGDGNAAYGTPEQYNKVIVYETTPNGVEVVDWREYMIDYVDCRVISERELTLPKITYTWNYVSVVDEWSASLAANPPVVVVDIDSTSKKGYQLGGGRKVEREVKLHVFASSKAERNDIVDTLYDGLFNKRCQLLNFTSGSALDYDGTFYGRKRLLDRDPNPVDKSTYLFDMETVDLVDILYFDEVESRNISMPLITSTSRDDAMLSDLNANRAIIRFKMYYFDNRNILN